LKNKFLITFLFVVFSTPWARSGPLEDAFPVSGRIKAMGGAGVAASEDYSGAFYNPANLGYCKLSNLTLGYDMIAPRFRSLKNSDESKTINFNDYRHLATIGFCLKLPYHFRLGGYTWIDGFPSLNVNLQSVNDRPAYIFYGDRLSIPSTYVGLSFSPLRYFSVGVSAIISVSIDLTIGSKVNFANDPSAVFEVNARVRPSVAILGGISVEPTPKLRAGFAVRSPDFLQVKIATNTSVSFPYSIDPILRRFSFDFSNLAQAVFAHLGFTPLQVAFGLWANPIDTLIMTAELTWYNWSAFEGPFLSFENAEGSTYELSFPVAESPKFKDSVQVRAGAEYTFKQIGFRVGYAYRSSPARPPESKSGNLLDSDVHTVSWGIGYELGLSEKSSVLFDAFASAGILSTRDYRTDQNEWPILPVGGVVWHAGATVTLRF